MRRPFVICYHAVSSTWPAKLAISESLLLLQLRQLAERGYVGLTLSEAERRRADGSIPPKAVVVTFDDGYESTMRARPVLEEVGFPATVFVVTRFVDSGELLSWAGVEHWTQGEFAQEMRPAGWRELELLREAGWEVGSHTVSHPRLLDIAGDQLAYQLEASRETIVRRLGACDTIAYPFGLADRRVADAAAAAGYLAGVTLSSAHRADEPHLRPRVLLHRRDTGLRLRVKLSPAFLSFRRTSLAAGVDVTRKRLGAC